MSSGLIIERASPPSEAPTASIEPLPTSPRVLLLIGTPSTTISGVLLPMIDLLPRRRILEAPPAPPADGVMVTPDTLPSRELATLGSCTRLRSEALTCCVEYVREVSLRLIPMAVTTTSLSTELSSAILTSTLVRPAILTSCAV